MSAAAAYAKTEHASTLDPAEAEAAAAAALTAGEGLRRDIAALPFGAEAPSYRTTLLAVRRKP